MSTTESVRDRRRRQTLVASVFEGGPARVLALGACLLLLGAFFSVALRVTDVVGGTAWLLLLGGGAFALATVLGPRLPEGHGLHVGIAIGAGFLVAGLGGYLLLIPDVYYALFSVHRVYSDTIALLTGQSVLLLLDADLWILGIVPGPVFSTWFLGLRRRYDLAAIVGGGTLGFFTLTGDASSTVTVLGMVGALGVIGFGSIERWNGTIRQLQDAGLVLVGAVLVTRLLSIVPDGANAAGTSFGDGATLEGTLVGAPGQVPVVGSITLSPAVRFTVRADSAAYWRVAAYDRYTGQGWASTADLREYSGTLPGPPGESRQIVQQFEFRRASQAMPAAWKPVHVDDDRAGSTLVSDHGGFQPVDGIGADEQFRVVSRAPEWSAEELRDSPKAYPDAVRRRFLQLPESTPSRLADRASAIADDADSPFDAVTRIRDWLESEKGYSLEVNRPETDVADEFVFNMDEGYCVYFATALTVMLRTIGIPARFVVGYSTGERIEENTYRVRGLDSHAWVEVFFPESGWITVDPTPSDPRESVRVAYLQGGGTGDGDSAGDGADSEDGRFGPGGRTPPITDTSTLERRQTSGNNTSPAATGDIPEEVREMQEGENPAPGEEVGVATVESGGTPADDGEGSTAEGTGGRPTGGDRLTLLAGAAGLAIGAYRIGVLERLYRSVWVRRQSPTGDAETDVERAFERLEYYLSEEHRSRRRDETPRAYVSALDAKPGFGLDDRVHRVLDLYERVRYSDDPRPEGAREAIRLVDELVDER